MSRVATLFLCAGAAAAQGAPPPAPDWLVTPVEREVHLTSDEERGEISLQNGLVRRTWRLRPAAATVALDNLMTGASMLRAVKPEALLALEGREIAIGGFLGQPNHAYLTAAWLDQMAADPAAWKYQDHKVHPIRARLPWKRGRYSADLPWPPPGLELALRFTAHPGRLAGVEVTVHHEMYQGLPLLSKWLTVRNGTDRPIELQGFTSEILAAVEHESAVESPNGWRVPNLHVETDYAMHGMSAASANVAVHWVPDPEYLTQVNYRRQTPALLECRPPVGPGAVIAPGESFDTFRTFILVHDSTDRERQGLAVRRMYRTIAPWVTENPILMHVRRADPEAVRLAIDQCAEVGFEMVILTFGSGFNIENEDPAYLKSIRELVDYAHGKGIELGGYSLLASRRVSDEHDVIHPETGKTGGAIFGNSPCLESAWGRDYFRKLYAFYEATGMDLLEHDGSYPGDLCASTAHPGHRGLHDSRWSQWKKITDFYRWCRGRGIYLNVPDWYYLTGSNKTGMGYRETNWSLPRAQQIVHARQNIFDGTWAKTPSMGWMFVPLVEYHGGGPAATLEPLSEHLDAYAAHLANNFGLGVQACYRGPRLYDTPATKAVVEQWVAFYKRHRAILDSDLVHVRRADGRDVDCMLHVNAQLPERGLAMVYNPLAQTTRRQLVLPLYYTGLTKTARIRERQGAAKTYQLDRHYRVTVELEIAPRSATWLVIE